MKICHLNSKMCFTISLFSIYTSSASHAEFPTHRNPETAEDIFIEDRKFHQSPCLQSCSANTVSPAILQTCVDECKKLGHCCGNRLSGEDTATSNKRLSCANGCEIAYYSATVSECISHCNASTEQDSCKYEHPFIPWEFGKCGNGNCTCGEWPDDNACETGCTAAAELNGNDFYQFDANMKCSGPDEIPRFLFAGQSNMVGHSNHGLRNGFDSIINILNHRKFTKRQKIRRLTNLLNKAKDAEPETSINEARRLFSLRRFLKRSIRKDHENAVCSFTVPKSDESPSLDCERPVSPSACGAGGGYGPELLFSYCFPDIQSPYKNQTIGIVKVVKPGTEIYKNWMKENRNATDNYWTNLVHAIEGSKGTIRAFVWFQGESDSFDTWNIDNYLVHLTTFINDVRKEIFVRSTSDLFVSHEDIPVVIIELGQWLYGENRRGVIEAQRAFVESDQNSILVSTGAHDDPKKRLSRFYHYDPAALLIIGNRLAKGLAKLVLRQNSAMISSDSAQSSHAVVQKRRYRQSLTHQSLRRDV